MTKDVMRIVKNTEPASWIPARLHRFAQDVGSVIPEGFAAYARVFHPAYRLAADGEQQPVRWREIAAANERTIEAEMQRLDISSDPTRFAPSGEALWDQQSAVGSIPHEIAARLATILTAHTRTPELCWFAVWEGWGDLRIGRDAGPTFSVPGRKLFLLQGSINDVLTTLSQVEWSYRSPNLWWPDDRAWCVATEIDFKWTYVGGSPTCVQQVLNDPELEALPTRPEQGNAMEK
jgi:hypothetical protein